MAERKNLIQWVKEHKKQLIIAGIGIGTLILIIWGIKNRKTIESLLDSLKDAVKNPTAKNAEEISKAVMERALVPEPIPLPEPDPVIVPVTASNLEELPFAVRRHIRNLPDGWHASPEKIEEALRNNITLMDGQTWVDSYLKGSVVA